MITAYLKCYAVIIYLKQNSMTIHDPNIKSVKIYKQTKNDWT